MSMTDENNTMVEEVIEEVHSQTVRESWPYSLAQMRVDMAHFKPDQQEALIALFLWCTDAAHPIKRADACAKIGCSPNLLYQLYTGKYRNPKKPTEKAFPSAELIKSIRHFLKLEADRFALGESEFVLTPTAGQVITACKLALESGTIVVLYGPSHVGKTMALKHFRAANNHGKTFMTELDAGGGQSGLVRSFSKACGYNGRANIVWQWEHVSGALTENNLMIIDEMHLLYLTQSEKCFITSVEKIRRLHDFRKVPLVCCWTDLAGLENASHGVLTQMWRRGVHKVALPKMPTKGDIGCILHHHKMEGEPVAEVKGTPFEKVCVFPDKKMTITVDGIVESPYAILQQQAKNFGLKAITERIRYARKLTGKADGEISWTNFVRAHLIIEKQTLQLQEWV